MTVPKNIPRGTHKKGSKRFNEMRSGYIKARRKDLEKFAREEISKTMKELRDEIHAIEVTDHNISLFDKDNQVIIIIK